MYPHAGHIPNVIESANQTNRMYAENQSLLTRTYPSLEQVAIRVP